MVIDFPCDADVKRSPSPVFLGKANKRTQDLKPTEPKVDRIIILMQRLTSDPADLWLLWASGPGAEPLVVPPLGRCSLNCKMEKKTPPGLEKRGSEKTGSEVNGFVFLLYCAGFP